MDGQLIRIERDVGQAKDAFAVGESGALKSGDRISQDDRGADDGRICGIDDAAFDGSGVAERLGEEERTKEKKDTEKKVSGKCGLL